MFHIESSFKCCYNVCTESWPFFNFSVCIYCHLVVSIRWHHWPQVSEIIEPCKVVVVSISLFSVCQLTNVIQQFKYTRKQIDISIQKHSHFPCLQRVSLCLKNKLGLSLHIMCPPSYSGKFFLHNSLSDFVYPANL